MVSTGRRSGPVSTFRVVAPFLAIAVVVLVLVGALLVVLERDRATDEAVDDARSLTAVVVDDVVGDHLDDAALAPGAAQDELDALVREHVLGDRIVRVKVWTQDGTVAYSDVTSLIGQRFPFEGEERRLLLEGGAPLAEVSDLDAEENVDEQQFGRLLQVYVSARTPEGTPVLFETYQPYDRIEQATRRTLHASVPPLLVGLVVIALLQGPLAWRIARRMRTAHEGRESALLASLAASDRERRRIAADLHDGVVQGLSGASLTLAAAGARARAGGSAEFADVAEDTAADLRRRVRELRSLVVTVAPPALHEQGLAVSLADLAAVLESAGTRADVRTVGPVGAGQVDVGPERLVFRTAQEAVRNVVRHAGAQRAWVSLTRDAEGLSLEVSDDGRGYDVAATAARSRGSVGLELLTGLAEELGGRLSTTSRPGEGTTVVLRLPARVLGEVLQ